ncbi:DNA topoisomerase IB [Pseudonocardia bannensis]|uniref:DNA topoisomerase n=1 Tax=Pseudonocardia bannensis TaxID=630973 RepID=A0A848DE19_9PSEU|nr:DNA topoisomerase IB [Pseudonocardia bannensis]NMH90870.1 DNA topoisomerase IB [Pseudonocardia bannensis]
MTALGSETPVELVRVDPASPGFARRRCGRGFSYTDVDGARLTDPAEVGRIKALVIPPAWRDVWICPDPAGHIQAVGTDDAGRRQYLYHPEWRRRRDAEKHDRVLELGRRLADVRVEVVRRLGERGLGRDRVLAAAVRMLDVGVFRAGGEQYAPDGEDSDDSDTDDGTGGTFGLATLRREHVRLRRGAVCFSYPAKGGVPRTLELRDPLLRRVVNSLLRRRGGGEDLLAYRIRRDWHDVRSEDLNIAVKELAGEAYTCKDLRTWNATVLAAATLAAAAADGGVPNAARSRKRMINAAMTAVSEHLGNTPAVARSSYVDPRVLERFEDGRTVLTSVRRLGDTDLADDTNRAALERAVVRLIRSS